MKENSPADKQSLIENEVGEHLRFYRLCGIMAAASVVFITLLTVLVYPESMHENAYRVACLVYGPATLLLLLGMFKYPTVCSWILFAAFHAMLLYLFIDGTTFNLVISTLFSLFFYSVLLRIPNSIVVSNDRCGWRSADANQLGYCVLLHYWRLY